MSLCKTPCLVKPNVPEMQNPNRANVTLQKHYKKPDANTATGNFLETLLLPKTVPLRKMSTQQKRVHKTGKKQE